MDRPSWLSAGVLSDRPEVGDGGDGTYKDREEDTGHDIPSRGRTAFKVVNGVGSWSGIVKVAHGDGICVDGRRIGIMYDLLPERFIRVDGE